MAKKREFPDRFDIRRILLPLPFPAGSLDTLGMVTGLAGQLRVEVLGLVVQDEAATYGAALSLSREVRRLPAALVASTSQEVERQVQARVRHLEATLLRRAREVGIQSRLQVTTGTAVEGVRAASDAGDLIVSSGALESPQQAEALLESLVEAATHPVLVVHPRQPIPRAVTVIVPPTPEGERALHVAGQVAQRLGRVPLTVLTLDNGDEHPPDAVRAGREVAETYEVVVTTRSIATVALRPLSEALSPDGHRLLVVPGALLRSPTGPRLRTLRTLPGPFLVTP